MKTQCHSEDRRMPEDKVVTRFAPSPSGHLHLGHAYSAMFAENAAEKQGGQFLLRIEDIDEGRCRSEFEESIMQDLDWLGLSWEKPVHRQSDHLNNYKIALDMLREMGVLYPCFCTRKEILAEIKGAVRAPHEVRHGPDGPIYPGICRNLTPDERESRLASNEPFALRLNITRAHALVGNIQWIDLDHGLMSGKPEIFGDVVLARKDIPTSYHLSVTVDDNFQKVTLVTRGEDLRHATHIHRLLQELLNYDVPEYQFHRLLSGRNGRRYSKRDTSVSLRLLREAGHTPNDIRKLVSF